MPRGRPRSGQGEFEKHLVISDLHGVYVDEKALSVVLQVWAENEWSSLILNGDVVDAQDLSSHKRKVDHAPSFSDELDWTYEKILEPLRMAKPKGKILYRFGNHDERVEKRLSATPEAMQSFIHAARKRNATDLGDMLRLPELKIDLSRNEVDVLSCRGRKFHLLHGYKTNKTRCEHYLRDFGSGTSGHTHRLERASRVTYYGTEQWVESGCLRTMDRVEYMASPFAGWTHAFVSVWIDKAYGQTFVRQHEILDYRVEYGGKLYTA